MGQIAGCDRTAPKVMTAVIYSDKKRDPRAESLLTVPFRYNGITASINRNAKTIEKIRLL